MSAYLFYIYVCHPDFYDNKISISFLANTTQNTRLLVNAYSCNNNDLECAGSLVSGSSKYSLRIRRQGMSCGSVVSAKALS